MVREGYTGKISICRVRAYAFALHNDSFRVPSQDEEMAIGAHQQSIQSTVHTSPSKLAVATNIGKLEPCFTVPITLWLSDNAA